MFSKRRSQLLLIRVNPANTIRLIIPVPFFVLDIILQAVGDLVLLGDILSPLWLNKLKHHKAKLPWTNEFQLTQAWDIVQEFVRELRKYGRWRMVEVKTEEAEVYIDLY